jgi:hypothetical protein
MDALREPSMGDVLNNVIRHGFDFLLREMGVTTDVVHCREPALGQEFVNARRKDFGASGVGEEWWQKTEQQTLKPEMMLGEKEKPIRELLV